MANLGRFVELYEVQVAVVAMIYLDLVASTAQLLPYLQAAEDETGGGARGAEGVAMGSTGAGFRAFALRLVSRLMQVNTWLALPFAFGRFFKKSLLKSTAKEEGVHRRPCVAGFRAFLQHDRDKTPSRRYSTDVASIL